MSSVATRAPTGSVDLRPATLSPQARARLTPAQSATATLRARANCSSLELELFLIAGGTLAQWYACAASPPIATPEETRAAELARLIRLMPDGLDPDEQAEYIAAAERRGRR